MYRALTIPALIIVGVVSVASSTGSATETHPRPTQPIASCEPPTASNLSEFLRTSRSLVAASNAADLRDELGLAPWQPDSVHLVTDSALCARVDSLAVAWLAGAGAGKLTGVAGTLGDIQVARVGATVFHVDAYSVPPQAIRRASYFVIDTAAPARVAYWGNSNH
jgi:hypothetical protein